MPAVILAPAGDAPRDITVDFGPPSVRLGIGDPTARALSSTPSGPPVAFGAPRS